MSQVPTINTTVEVIVACDAWLSACPEAVALVQGAARAALAGTLKFPIAEIRLTDDSEQRRLNRIYRGKDAPTNVLSFPLTDTTSELPIDAPVLLGDVVLAFETVQREAIEQRKSFTSHLRHLVVHGVLHLLGFDHENDADAAIMETREIEILAALGVPDPYRDTM